MFLVVKLLKFIVGTVLLLVFVYMSSVFTAHSVMLCPLRAVTITVPNIGTESSDTNNVDPYQTAPKEQSDQGLQCLTLGDKTFNTSPNTHISV